MSKFPKVNKSTEVKAKSVEEAVELALQELGITKENAEVEVVQEPQKGFLGIGGKEAVVRVTAKNSCSADEKTEVKAEPAPKRAKNKTTSGIYTSESPAENAKNFISDVLSAMGLDVKITAELNDDTVNVNIEGDNMGVVIGKRGDTLDSIQYLTSLVVNQKSEDYIKVSIDTENYREKREEALVALAARLAGKVGRTGKKFALEPMNPYERRIIHASLQDNEEVTTFSVGQEPYRKVVIAPKNAKPYGNKRNSDYNRSRRNDSDAKADEPKSSADTPTYKADFKPQQHKAEFKNFEEYLAAHSKD